MSWVRYVQPGVLATQPTASYRQLHAALVVTEIKQSGVVLGLPNLKNDINRSEHATVLDMPDYNKQYEAADGMFGTKRMLWNTSTNYEVYVLRKGESGIGMCSGRREE